MLGLGVVGDRGVAVVVLLEQRPVQRLVSGGEVGGAEPRGDAGVYARRGVRVGAEVTVAGGLADVETAPDLHGREEPDHARGGTGRRIRDRDRGWAAGDERLQPNLHLRGSACNRGQRQPGA